MSVMVRSFKMVMALLVLLAVASACGAAEVVPTGAAAGPTATTAPTATARPTNTPRPTRTPRPTSTPRPTNTPRPTPTPTPKPEPIVLSGTGDAVVDVEKWPGAALARIRYSGSRNFVVWNYGANGEKIDLLVNTIGAYEGTRPLDLLDGEYTSRFQVQASGAWEIEVLPLEQIRLEPIPGTFSGQGDDVVLLYGGTPDLLKVDATLARSNFAIWSYGDHRDLLVNEIAPYQGTVIAGRDTIVLVIEAEGPWGIEVTVR